MRFQCLLGCLNQSPETIDFIILACITLHNLHRIRNPSIVRQAIDHEDEHKQLQPGEWRHGRQMVDGDHIHGRNAVTSAGVYQTDYLKNYFNSPAGSVEWQEIRILRRYNNGDSYSITSNPTNARGEEARGEEPITGSAVYHNAFPMQHARDDESAQSHNASRTNNNKDNTPGNDNRFFIGTVSKFIHNSSITSTESFWLNSQFITSSQSK
ncbi:unnamed protein product [Mytilus coruscus]|uniref:Uncharacterized protein n=1 Tax=Mytilus coruscus TaxID=42192 RepID=A0A6J8BBY6_MYTCO|nr:unnamed protein product [Mytilus coruscus]